MIVISAPFLLISASVRADTEPNDGFATAEPIVSGSYSGSLGVSPPGDNNDYYSLTTTQTSTWVYVNVTIPEGGPTMNIRLLDSAHNWVGNFGGAGPGVSGTQSVFFTPQTVYIWLNRSSGSGTYQMDVLTTLTQLDWDPPVIQDIAPPDMSVRATKTPTISANYFDVDTGIDVSSVVLKVDDVDVTSSATVTGSGVTYTASPLTEGIHSVYLGVEDNRHNSAAQMWNFTVDTLGPTITDMRPANASSTSSSTPLISANYSDPSGINLALVVFVVDDLIQTPNATVTATGISYIPAQPLAAGTHCAGLGVKDNVGNARLAMWCFTVSASTSTSGSFIDQYWWSLVLVAAIIVAVIAVALIRARRRKPAEMPSSGPMPPQ
jgi:hypothetical protein